MNIAILKIESIRGISSSDNLDRLLNITVAYKNDMERIEEYSVKGNYIFRDDFEVASIRRKVNDDGVTNYRLTIFPVMEMD